MADGFQITPELIETIQQSALVELLDIPRDGKVLVTSDGNVREFYPKTQLELQREAFELAKPEIVHLSTLQGFADYAQADQLQLVEGGIARIHVPTPDRVLLCEETPERKRYVLAECTPQGLPAIPILKEPVSLDDALIQMQQCFEQDAEVDKVVDVLSTVKIEDLAELKDSGTSKEVVVTARVTGGKKNSDANVQGLSLKPLRTFPEVDIVPSLFSFRWQRKGDTVLARLIERQHHLWRYQQCQAVAERLRELLPEVRVLV